MAMSTRCKISIPIISFFALLFLLIINTTGRSPQTVTTDTSPGPAEIYATHCIECHGANGRALTKKGRQLDATDFTGDWNTDEARGIRIITNGKGDMPAFKKKLRPSEIKAVFRHVLKFRR